MTVRICSPRPVNVKTSFGPHAVEFINGVAEVQELPDAVREYLLGAGYTVDGESAPAVPEVTVYVIKLADVLEVLQDFTVEERDEIRATLALFDVPAVDPDTFTPASDNPDPAALAQSMPMPKANAGLAAWREYAMKARGATAEQIHGLSPKQLRDDFGPNATD